MKLHRIQTVSVASSNGFRGKTLSVIRVGAWAPGTFTTGSGGVLTDAEAVHFSYFVLALKPQALLHRVQDGFRDSALFVFHAGA